MSFYLCPHLHKSPPPRSVSPYDFSPSRPCPSAIPQMAGSTVSLSHTAAGQYHGSTDGYYHSDVRFHLVSHAPQRCPLAGRPNAVSPNPASLSAHSVPAGPAPPLAACAQFHAFLPQAEG